MKKNTKKTKKFDFNPILTGTFFISAIFLAIILAAIVKNKSKKISQPLPIAATEAPRNSTKDIHDPEVFELVGKISNIGDNFLQVEYEQDGKSIVVDVKNDGKFFRFENVGGNSKEVETKNYIPEVGKNVLLRFVIPISKSKISSATLVADKIIVNPDIGDE